MKVIIILMFSLLLNACSSSGGKNIDKLYYRFPQVTKVAVNKNLTVIKPTAMGILANRPMVAQNANGGLLQMSHNFWLDSPKVLLFNYLNKVFVKTEDTQNKLLSEIVNLEKVGQTSILAIKFSLIDANNKLVFSKAYKVEQSLQNNDIPSFVKSISASLENIIQQLLNEI